MQKAQNADLTRIVAIIRIRSTTSDSNTLCDFLFCWKFGSSQVSVSDSTFVTRGCFCAELNWEKSEKFQACEIYWPIGLPLIIITVVFITV